MGRFHEWQRLKSDVLCRCGCGQFITNRAAQNVLKGRPNAGYCHGHIWKGRSIPESTKEALRVQRPHMCGEANPNYGKGLFGDQNPNWQGGKKGRYVKNNQPGRGGKADRALVASIKARDKECVLCGETSRLNTHHIECYMDAVDLRFEPMNCVVLCKSCHARADNAHHKESIKPMLLAYIHTLYKEGNS